jgi:hypothetical protein
MKLTLYHGTDYNVAELIQAGSFEPKPNPCHWLGNGVYFYFDRPLAEWWTSNPTAKYGCEVSHPALVKVEVEIEENQILDLRKFKTYVNIAEEFERFFTQLYIPYHRVTISEMQIKCLFFDWYFLSHPDIKMIIGDFYSLEQPYFQQDERDFYAHTNLLFGETQVCLKKEHQSIIINKEVIDLCPIND